MTINPAEPLAENPAAPSDPEPQPPVEPPLEACCSSGCYPCILDLYTEELQQYRADHSAWLTRQSAANASALPFHQDSSCEK